MVAIWNFRGDYESSDFFERKNCKNDTWGYFPWGDCNFKLFSISYHVTYFMSLQLIKKTGLW